MKTYLFLITILFSASVFGQTKKIIKEDQDAHIREEYYVLKSDKNIKEGTYTVYALYNSQLICEGFYKNNKRDSVWYTFDLSGQPEVKYDYTHKKLLFYKKPANLADTKEYDVIDGVSRSKQVLDQPPIFIDAYLYRLSSFNIHYPAEAKQANIQGKVWIAFTVDTLGHLSNYRVKQSIGGGCDEEALRVIKMLKGSWLPGILHGNPVNVEYQLPINFKLQSN